MSQSDTYTKAIRYLDSFVNYELRLPGEARAYGLDRIRELLTKLGSPHKKTPFVHIAGSKGKGSTAAMLEAILIASGYKVGLYTSPHLIDLKERVRIDGASITEELFAEIIFELRPHLEDIKSKRASGRDVRAPTYYEIFTHLAMRAFEISQCDIAILEVGLGGRLDATNVIESPLAVGITEIALEHTHILGDTLTKIAHEKAGIIKEGRPVVTSAKSTEALDEITRVAKLQAAPIWRLGGEIKLRACAGDTFEVTLPGCPPLQLTTNLLGTHQTENATLAASLAELLRENGFEKITTGSISKGLQEVHWPGRLQLVTANSGRRYLLDGAHTLGSVKTLINEALKISSKEDTSLVFAVADDKDYPAMLAALAEISNTITLTTSGNPRGVPPETLLPIAEKYFATVKIQHETTLAIKNTIAKLTIVTGSLYLVGRALEILQ